MIRTAVKTDWARIFLIEYLGRPTAQFAAKLLNALHQHMPEGPP